jgi:CAAX prenyl protease-like protein
MQSPRSAFAAHVVPFALFMLGLALVSAVQRMAGPSETLLLAKPAYWVYPLQSLACAIALAFFWKRYEFGPRRPIPLAVGVGIGVFVLWASPQLLFGQPPRLVGFDPSPFADTPALYAATIAMRFLRLVLVVPLVEEIFWRGFLQRYLVDERFTTVPFGKYTPLSFWGVAVMFTLVHAVEDWPAALVTGAIYGWIAIRTKSLLACIVAHATTNLALGLYIMATRQWGFW